MPRCVTQKAWMSLGAALISAVLLILAYPQTHCWPLAWVGLVPLILLIDGQSSKSAFGWAFLSGYLFFFGVLGWLVYVTYPGAILLMAYLALYLGCFAVLYQWFFPLPFFLRLLAQASAWTVLEYIRSHLFTGFGWALLGHSQASNLPFIQIASFTGVYGISFMLVLVNLVIAHTVLFFIKAKGRSFTRAGADFVSVRETGAPRPLALRPQGTGKETGHGHCREIIIAWTGLVFFIGGMYLYGFIQMQHSHRWPTVNVGVVQPNIPQKLKWLPQMQPVIVDKHIALSSLFHQGQPDLIVWPETALPGIVSDEETLVTSIQATAYRQATPILFGAVTVDHGKYFNSAILVDAHGQFAGTYHKIHLVPFGEYLPLRPLLGWINRFVPLEDFTSGQEFFLFDVIGHPHAVGVLICFEDTLSDIRRNFVRAGAKLLVNMTNDAWFEDTKAPFMHLDAAVFGCVENRRALVRSANTGFSGFIDPYGRVTGAVVNAQGKKTFIAGVSQQDVPLVSEKTFYTKYADLFTFVCACVILLSVMMLVRRRGMVVS